jgi:hypothetical protein
MATFIDIHDLPGVKPGMSFPPMRPMCRVGPKFGVDYQHYWVDEAAGKVFCLVEAPDREAAIAVHREAHGLVAQDLFEVTQGA